MWGGGRGWLAFPHVLLWWVLICSASSRQHGCDYRIAAPNFRHPPKSETKSMLLRSLTALLLWALLAALAPAAGAMDAPAACDQAHMQQDGNTGGCDLGNAADACALPCTAACAVSSAAAPVFASHTERALAPRTPPAPGDGLAPDTAPPKPHLP